jgi:hypothetical protein
MKHIKTLLLLSVLSVAFVACDEDNQQPVIDAGDELIGMTGETTDLIVTVNDPDGDAFQLTWNVIESPSGATPEIENTSNTQATFLTEVAGIYKLEVVVEDGKGGMASDMLTLYISGALPRTIDETTLYPDVFEDASIPDYFAMENVTIKARVTFIPGVIVESESDVYIHVAGSSASLTAEGTTSQRILFTGIDKVKGSWRGISISSSSVNNKLDYVDVMYAGSSDIGDTKTSVFMKSNTDTKLSITNTNISESGGYAFTTDGDDAVLTAFENNNFSNNELAPLQIGGENLYALDETSVFSDNGIQAIEIIPGRVTFDNPGTISYSLIPLHFYGEAHLRSTVTFSEGVACLFDADLRLWVTNEGAIIAEGTSGNEVIFSGMDEAPGAWKGIELDSPSTMNKLDFCHIKYGGSSGGRGANIYMFGSSNGSYLSLSNSYVGDSQTYGIYRASGSTTLNTSSVTYANNSSGDIYEE